MVIFTQIPAEVTFSEHPRESTFHYVPEHLLLAKEEENPATVKEVNLLEAVVHPVGDAPVPPPHPVRDAPAPPPRPVGDALAPPPAVTATLPASTCLQVFKECLTQARNGEKHQCCSSTSLFLGSFGISCFSCRTVREIIGYLHLSFVNLYQ